MDDSNDTAGQQTDESDSSSTVKHRKMMAKAKLTLSAASRLLKRKIPHSGHLLYPRRMWMQTVPTQDCDVVMVFAPKAGEATVNCLVSLLRTRIPDLVVNVKHHVSTGCYTLYISASIDGLIKGGEELRLLKKTKAEFGSGLREMNQMELSIFQGVEEIGTFFTCQERQTIVVHLLYSLRASEGEQLGGITFRVGESIVSKCHYVGVIQQILPLHDHQKLASLRKSWVQKFFRYQPLDEIQDYFGAKIAIYFAWLGYYTASLIVPAIIGLVFWVCFWGGEQAQEDKAFVMLAFLNVVWGSMWLEGWKRRSAELAYRWGTLDPQYELLSDPRPMFTGNLEVSPVTGRIEPVYSSWKRNLFRYFVTVPVILFCLFIVLYVMLIILRLQDWCDSYIEDMKYPQTLSYIPKILMAVAVSLFDEGYIRIAVWLNDMENYRGEEGYHNHLIVKLAVLRFVNSFLSLFYIAFYLQDMERLKEQLVALLLTRQVVGNIKESCIPYILEQLKLAKLSFDLYGAMSPSEENLENDKAAQEEEGDQGTSKEAPKASEAEEVDLVNHEEQSRGSGDDSATSDASGNISRLASKSRIVSQAEVECNMAKYEDTLEDYLEMFIQFGYVMLFSSAFPLTAAFAFLNNIVEIRSDAFKICCVFQRPFGQRVGSIGVWQDAMEFMGLVGIIVNCMLIGLSGQVHRMFPEMSTTQTILLIVALEHIMIALKYGISYAIPDVPEWVVQQTARAEFRRRECLRRISVSATPPTREASAPSSPSTYWFY